MLVHQGIYLPDGEKHLVEWMSSAGEMVDGRGSYQVKKLRKALSYCTQFRTACDVGSHVGLWSLQLAKKFAATHAFEPVEAHRECFLQNMEGAPNAVILHPFALGSAEGFIEIETAPTSSGDSRVDINAKNPTIPMRTLDSFDLVNVDFMKLDCEGYELNALHGGENTIKRDMPVIIVEQKKGRAQRFGLPETGAVDYLQGLGYKLAEVMSGDFILVPA